MAERQKCSKCSKTKTMSKFQWDQKKGRREKVCMACKRRRKKRILQRKLLGQRCEECNGPPTFRDMSFGGSVLTRFKGQKLCSECLVPHLTDEELYAWMLYRLKDCNYYWNDYVKPEEVDWFGEGEKTSTQHAKRVTLDVRKFLRS